MSQKTLEKFIKIYLNNRLVSDGKSGYDSWKRKNGIDTGAILASGLINGDTAYRRSLSSYGKNAEHLGGAGLVGSGYAAYLDEKARETARRALTEADNRYAESEAKNKSAYASHLGSELAAKEKLIKSAESKLKSDGYTSFEEAYAAAGAMGVSDEDAKRIAKEATERKISELRLKVISAIVNKRYTAEEAEKYATSLGLPEEVAKELSELARSTNQKISLGNKTGYLDYLKELAKEQSGK